MKTKMKMKMKKIKLTVFNGNNELVKIFKEEKCCVCLEYDVIYAFRNCGHLSVCEVLLQNSDSNKLTKCVDL